MGSPALGFWMVLGDLGPCQEREKGDPSQGIDGVALSLGGCLEMTMKIPVS